VDPKFITIHCSATKPKVNYNVDRLRETHVNQNGWSDIGYHFYITTDGRLTPCRPLSRNGAHVKGYNTDNIGICLEGGLNNDTGRPDDTYTSYQYETLRQIVKDLQERYGISDSDVKGHRDWGANKACPCFDVSKWLKRAN